MAKISGKKAKKVVAALPQGKKAAVKAASKAAAKADKAETAPMSKYGRVGTPAEMYKRVIMAGLSNAEAHAAVAKDLGPAAAGPASNAPWYRWWLKKEKFNPPASKRAPKAKAKSKKK